MLHRYARFDLHESSLDLTIDLSGVPCGCLACVYLVTPEDPDVTGSNYCDMAENVRPGYGGGTCTELDLFEANNNAMQTAIHTELGGSYGSGNCDRNGCFARVGGPQSPSHLQNAFGRGRTIDSSRPFRLNAAIDGQGALEINLHQGSSRVTSFNRQMAGNPQGHGVPQSALSATREAQGHFALVASLWSAPDLSWLDGPGCNQCNLATAHMRITVNSAVDAAVPVASGATHGSMVEDAESAAAAAALASCDESACTSVGNDCCAPGNQPRTCSGDLTSVDLEGDCFGHVNARYTCCPATVDAEQVRSADASGRQWTVPDASDDATFILAGRRVLDSRSTAMTATIVLPNVTHPMAASSSNGTSIVNGSKDTVRPTS